MSNPFNIVRQFEKEVALYAGAPYAVSVASCTAALMLAIAWHLRGGRDAPMTATMVRALHRPGGPYVEIPCKTYVGVGHSILNAGGKPEFRDEIWSGCYQLKPFPIWDSARWFTSNMYNAIGCRGSANRTMVCVSHHAQKTLGDTQGGTILHDDPGADVWLRRARFDGRAEGVAPKDDIFDQRAWHCYLSPDVAARLLWKLSVLPKHNEPLPNDDYPDLSTFDIFK